MLRLLLVAAVGLYAGGVIAFNLVTFSYGFARRPSRIVARAFVVEVAVGLLLLPLWPLWMVLGASFEAVEAGEPRGEHRPVVLLHGYAMNRTNWLWLGRRLASLGIGPLFGMNYFVLAPLARSAAALGRFVDEVRARTGAGRVDIVAHSMGGIVARAFIEQLGGADRVGRLVTIGTPHGGTRLGAFGLGASSREMTTGSPFLDGLARGQRPAGVKYASVWSRCDNLVVPPESSRLDDSDVIFEDLGHLSLLVSPRVADAVAARLSA